MATDSPISALITQLTDAWNSHDVDQIACLHAESYQGEDVAQAVSQAGRAGVCEMFQMYWQAFPDLQVTLCEIIQEGDRVSLLWTAEGTHRGPLLRIPPTGRTIRTRGVSLLTVQDNLVYEAFHLWDVAAVLRDLGLLPSL